MYWPQNGWLQQRSKHRLTWPQVSAQVITPLFLWTMARYRNSLATWQLKVCVVYSVKAYTNEPVKHDWRLQVNGQLTSLYLSVVLEHVEQWRIYKGRRKKNVIQKIPSNGIHSTTISSFFHILFPDFWIHS